MVLKLAEDLLQAVKENNAENSAVYQRELNSFPLKEAITQLKTDTDKLVFWTNIYNAYFQLIAQESIGDTAYFPSSIFRRNLITLFNQKLSFDEVEHFILRGAKWKYGLGYLPHFSYKFHLRSFRMTKLDARIHFLLNCGAVSCPMITVLTRDNLAQELEWGTRAYLTENVKVDRKKKRIVLRTLFLFYLADFLGFKGIRKLLLIHSVLAEEESYFRFEFIAFNKDVQLGNFG